MNIRRWSALVGIVVSLTVGVSGVSFSAESGSATVAQFVSRLALESKIHPSGTPGTAGSIAIPAAAWSDMNPGAALTYGMVSRIAADLGVQVAAPGNPDAVVSAAQAGAIATAIAASRGGTGVGIPGDDLPTQCLNSDNRGKCVDCCKTASGQGGQFCGRFCHANVPPPPSPGEPQP